MNANPQLVGGRCNETPLTPRGVEQSKRLGRVMLEKQILPIKLYTSPALRTIDTARYSISEMGLDIELHVEDSIQELGQGSSEGMSRSEVYTDEVLQEIARLGKAFKLKDGESMDEVGYRMLAWIKETFTQPPIKEPLRYFVYTHGGAIKYLASLLLGWSHRQTYETEIDNTSVNLFKINEGLCEVVYLNRDVDTI